MLSYIVIVVINALFQIVAPFFSLKLCAMLFHLRFCYYKSCQLK